MRRLRELLSGISGADANGSDFEVDHISNYANKIKPGGVYVACDLPWMDGYRAIGRAVERGAAAVVVDREVTLPNGSGCRTVTVGDSKKAYSIMCANFFNQTHRQMSLYAVTGTKGKTTTCHLLESIFRNAGLKTGLIGTIVRKIGSQEAESVSTTPEPYDLHSLLSEMRGAGVTHVILEVSSIGIAEERICGLRFEGLIFTNLGHEHLTYHGGLENYQVAKSRLFTEHTSADGNYPVCAINTDDAFGMHLASVSQGEVITYGLTGEVNGNDLALDEKGIYGEVSGIPIHSSLLGAHNAYNILGAVALSSKMNISFSSIAGGVSSLSSIPGRLERLSDASGVDVFVDYAHTPESVFVVLASMRELFAGRSLIVVLGCGGGSDRMKRPIMTKMAVENSDVCILTSDNPRLEEPMNIIEDMLGGVHSEEKDLVERGQLEVVIDRREAIHRGAEIAVNRGGVLVILGKGHERYQIVGNVTTRFDDREVVAEALHCRAERA